MPKLLFVIAVFFASPNAWTLFFLLWAASLWLVGRQVHWRALAAEIAEGGRTW
jgi:hypothetical protein